MKVLLRLYEAQIPFFPGPLLLKYSPASLRLY
jgi:hypothetical protein